MKDKIVESPKQFLLEFFKDADITDKNGVLTISGARKEFEDFVGKKAPYKFVFDFDLHTKIKDSELIMKGSYFLLAIRDYLADKGETSLLKIVPNNSKEITKSPKLKNYKIIGLDKESADFFYEFSFLSTYQYLNDKKQSVSNFFIKGDEMLNMDLTRFKIEKGNTDELSAQDPAKSYALAKKQLDRKVISEIKPLKIILREKLQKELARIKDHYFKQIQEKDEEVEVCANKIKMLQSKLRHTSYERDRSILERNIRESKERLENLKKKTYRERLKAEEAFHINDETEKHVLSIKNHLINVTLYSYPIYEFQVINKGKKSIVKYDPILDKII